MSTSSVRKRSLEFFRYYYTLNFKLNLHDKNLSKDESKIRSQARVEFAREIRARRAIQSNAFIKNQREGLSSNQPQLSHRQYIRHCNQ